MQKSKKIVRDKGIFRGNGIVPGLLLVIVLLFFQGLRWITSWKPNLPTSFDNFANKIASQNYQPTPLPADLDEGTKIITVLLFGRTKAGKSSLGNKLIKNDTFEVGNHLESNTTQTRDHITLLDGRYYLRIIDTPGFADNRIDRTNEEVLQDIISFVSNLQNGIDIGIYCIPAGSGISMHDIDELNHIGALLGKNVFKHTLIAVTKANTLETKMRNGIYQQYPKELPSIFESHGIFSFESEKVLFADFDTFEDKFVPSFVSFVADSSTYHPEISKDLNTSDTESIKLFLAAPEIQEIMKRNEVLMEEQKRAAETAKKLVEDRLQLAEENIKKNLEEQEVFKSKIEEATKKLEDEHTLNEELRETYTVYKQEQEKKLTTIMSEFERQASQHESLKKTVKDRDVQINNLKEQMISLQKYQISEKDFTTMKVIGIIILILFFSSLGIAAYKSPCTAFMLLSLLVSFILFVWMIYEKIKGATSLLFSF